MFLKKNALFFFLCIFMQLISVVMIRTFFKYLIFVLVMLQGLSSCSATKGTKTLYNPKEVAELSEKLGIPLSNIDKEDDLNMPLYAQASLWLGVKYRYGGITKKGVDCSGLVYNLYKDAYGKKVPSSTSELSKKTRKISSRDLRAGDLIFFATTNKRKKISHVGIYLKNGYFVHASSSRGVVVNHISENYYKKNWVRNGRF